MSRAARLTRLERLLRPVPSAETVPTVIRLVTPGAGLAPLLTINHLAGWPLVKVGTWHRDQAEDEGGFIARVLAGAGAGALLVEVAS